MQKYTAARDNYTKYKQIVEYTLQFEQYVGKFTVAVSSNCSGRDILTYWDFDNCCFGDEVISADFKYEENDDYLTIILADPETGEICEIEGDAEEFNTYIVKAEIIDAIKQ